MSVVISVLIPTYNAASTIERAVLSILDGTLSELEVVVVDDGSTDETGVLLDELARTDSRLRVLHERHRGLVPALNTGLRACRGDFVARMDADDWSAPDRLEAQLDLIKSNPDLDLVSCLVRYDRSDGQASRLGMQRYETWLNGLLSPEAIVKERFVESPVVHASILAHRRLFEGGYRRGLFPEDYELWLRHLDRGARFAKVPRVLLRVTDQPAGRTHQHPSCSPEAFRALKIDFLRRGPLRDVESVIVWGTGRNGKRWIRALAEQDVSVPRAVDLAPRKIGRRIHGALVIPPDDLPPWDACPVVLAAVGKQGGREWIRAWMDGRGGVEGRHYWAVC